MNPEDAGRTELLASVKALFRPVLCIAPDLELIGFTMLFCEGFLQAKVRTCFAIPLYNEIHQ
jgi:dynein heavy chain